MNGADLKTLETYRTLLLLSEIDRERDISQRELSRRLGIALGLVNSYLKNLVSKGYIRVKNFPRNRYGYLLTPQGMAEKSRLVYHHLNYFTTLYTATRQDFIALFRNLAEQGVKQVAFCGVDEVAEIAFLALRGAGLELALVMDDGVNGDRFCERPVISLADGVLLGSYPVVLTSLKRQEELYQRLIALGVAASHIHRPGNHE